MACTKARLRNSVWPNRCIETGTANGGKLG